MNLLTDEIKELFKQYPLYSQDGKGMDSVVLVKYFSPITSGTWLITEAEEQPDGDWLLFGYCHISCWEWGYVMLSELQNLKLPFGLTIERDLYISKAATVKELI
ncbi:MAG: DUF2958 domain-containing protein [Clostridia bacterium]|nr:DUF2958 domain-containing protein [Clostridia bacterium]